MITKMENGENSEHQRESSLRRNGKREMEYEAEDEPESLSRKRRLEPEERRRLKIERDRKHRAEMKERMKSDSDAILEDCVMDNQLKDSEKCDTGKKLKKAQGELTGKLKQILEFIRHKELNIEESSNLVKIFHDRAYKAEEEGYKIRMEQIKECLKETLETVENLRAENKTLQNNLKEMMCKMEEMQMLEMYNSFKAEKEKFKDVNKKMKAENKEMEAKIWELQKEMEELRKVAAENQMPYSDDHLGSYLGSAPQPWGGPNATTAFDAAASAPLTMIPGNQDNRVDQLERMFQNQQNQISEIISLIRGSSNV